MDQPPPKPAPGGSSNKNVVIVVVLVLLGVTMFCCCPGLLLPAIQSAREAARRMKCSNNLKIIGLGLHNYHTVHGSFPPAYVTDEDGNPLYSWRVLLLPYLENQNLYQQFDRESAWDSTENISVSETVIPYFLCPTSDDQRGPYTDYAVLVGPDTLFPGEKSVSLDEVKDGSSNTIMVIELRNSNIHWAEPKDIDVDDFLAQGINGHGDGGCGSWHPGGMMMGMADGSVHFVDEDTSMQVLESLSTRSGGESATLPRSPR